MEIERKALYNLLRMNWLNDPNSDVKPWQVQDYRSLSLTEIYRMLDELGAGLDEQNFSVFADNCESPEELADALVEDSELSPVEQDRVYLLIFELWRRLFPEKLSLSIFCDELDHQIYLYDKKDPPAAESIQDALANLQMIMDENLDQGIKPLEIFSTISSALANDLESFLYDYIAEQIDHDNIAYATELLDGFGPFTKGNRWFDLLKIRLLDASDSEMAQDELRKLVQRNIKENNINFNLEVLSFIVQGGEKSAFNKMVRNTTPLLKKEEDFLDLLSICSDYYRCRDEDQKERAVQQIFDSRKEISLDEPFKKGDSSIHLLLKLLK